MFKFHSTHSLNGKIIISSIMVMLIALFMKAAGYVEKRLLGHLFGAGDHLDAYLTAVKISTMGYFLLRGVLRPVITPLLTTLKNRSLAEARNYGISLALVVGGLLGLMTLGGIVFCPALVRFTAAGFAPDKQAECVRLTRWLMLPAFLMSLGHLMGLSLQVRKRFSKAAWGEFLQKCGLILGMALLVAPLGFSWLVMANWIGVICYFGYYSLSHIHYLKVNQRFEFTREPLRETLWLAWPVIVGSLISQLGRLIQTRYASGLLPGSVSALTFAQTTIDLPLNLLPLSLSIVLLPYFSEFADRKEYQRSGTYLGHATRFLLLVFVPIAAYCYCFRSPLTLLLFKSGRFDQHALQLTSQALAGLALGLPFFAIEIVLMNYFYASRRMIASMVCGMIATVVAVAALPSLAASFGVAGVSAYMSLGRATKIVLLGVYLYQINVRLPMRPTLAFALKLTCALVIAWTIHAGLDRLFPLVPWGRGKIPHLACSTILMAAGFFSSAYLLGIEECRSAVYALVHWRQILPANETHDRAQSDLKTMAQPEGQHIEEVHANTCQ